MKRYKVLQLGKKTYAITSLSPKICKRLIISLRGYKVEELKDIPELMNISINSIAIVLAGNGLFRLLKRFFIKRQLIAQLSEDEIIEWLNVILESIPSKEFYKFNIIINQFNNLTAK